MHTIQWTSHYNMHYTMDTHYNIHNTMDTPLKHTLHNVAPYYNIYPTIMTTPLYLHPHNDGHHKNIHPTMTDAL